MLLISMAFFSILMLLAVILSKMVYNSLAIEHSLALRERAFWAAEAGLQKAAAEIIRNPGWYTDLPHLPEDDKGWLSSGAAGQDEGWFKLVREEGKNRLYSIGSSGKARVFLRMDFASPPFRRSGWEEL